MLIALAVNVIAQSGMPFYFDNRLLYESAPVHAISQDNDDSYWLATARGLYSFDGYRFTDHTDNVFTQRIYSLFIDNSSPYILLGRENGLTTYNRRSGQYKTIKGSSVSEIKAITNNISSDGKKHIYVGGHEGLYEYYSGKLKLISSIPRDIYCICPTRRGLLIGTFWGLFQYTDGKCKKLNNDKILKERASNIISAIEWNESNGHYWIGTFHGLYDFDPFNKKMNPTPLGNVVVKSLETSDNGLLISSDDGLYTLQNNRVCRYVHDSRIPSSLGNDVIWTALSDHNHNIILGTDAGISILNKDRISIFKPLSYLTGMPYGNTLTSIFRDTHHTEWLGGSGGLISINGQTKTYSWYRQSDLAHLLPHNHVRDIFEDSHNRLWVSTDAGLGLIDATSGSVLPRMVTDPITGYNVPWIYDITEDSRGRLWLASISHGVYVVDGNELANAKYKCPALRNIVNGLPDLTCTQVICSGNNAWVLASGSLAIVNTENGKAKQFTKEKISFIMRDSKGHVWTASNEGLHQYNANGDELSAIKFKQDLQLDKIVTLVEVGNSLWVIMPSYCSIFVGGKCKATIRIPNIKATCAYYDNYSKHIVIGGDDGIVEYSQKDINSLINERSHIVLSQIFINGKLYKPYNNVEQLSKISLDHNASNMSFMLSDMPLSRRLPHVYAYKLDGLEKQWHFIDNLANPIVYNGASHGHYVLKICQVNGPGSVGDEVYRLHITILPPWYLTWWAKMTYFILALLFVVWSAKFYTTRQRLKKEKLVRLQVIGESEERMLFYNSLSAQLYEGLAKVMQGLARLSGKEDAKLLDEVKWETTLINAHVRQALDLNNVSRKNVKEQPAPIVISNYCRNILNGMKPEASKRGIKLVVGKMDNSVRFPVEIIEWDAAVYILFKSVIAYSASGSTITLDVTLTEEKQQISISLTTGKLIILDTSLPYFFQRYAVLGENTTNLPHDMYRIREYAERFDGHVDIIRSADNKISVRILLPLTDAITLEETSHNQQLIALDPSDEKLINEITATIEAHISDSDFNVTRLQESLGVGSKLLYRKIKQVKGMSPVEYIRYVRMKQAAMLLAQGKFSVSSVMYMVGFSNSGYFSKCFYKVFGVTPTKYKG